MRTSFAVMGLMLTSSPALAHPAAPSRAGEVAAVKAVLNTYKAAIEQLDARDTQKLFIADSTIYETGGSEGSYANYLAHHLTPELGAFRSFKYSDYNISVRFEGAIALASESYNYRIETKKGEIAERRGVATSVLKKVGGQWQIVSMHNSGRKPKGA